MTLNGRLFRQGEEINPIFVFIGFEFSLPIQKDQGNGEKDRESKQNHD